MKEKVAPPAPTAANGAEILVVEDDATFRSMIVQALAAHGYRVQSANGLASARRLLVNRSFDATLLDVHLADGSGLDLIASLREKAGAAPIVVMTNYATPTLAVEAMRRGAFDFLEKPADPMPLLAALERATEQARLARENASLRSIAAGDASVIPFEKLGPAMREIGRTIERVAGLQMPVLIEGESGTGKEYVARAIHAASKRSAATWLPVNCGGFRAELIGSELFGYEKGAFTGATDRRPGLVEIAKDGTLFLDEIGEITLEAQASLLRFIDRGEYRRVGASENRQSKARILAATNSDLRQAASAGSFREDLYFRLAAVSIRVPPLRERREDVAVFVRRFLVERSYDRPLSADVKRALEARPWPGNLRQLRNVVDRLVMIAGSDPVTLAHLEKVDPAPAPSTRGRTLAEVEREHIARTLEDHQWNRTQAALALGINPRTLYRKIRDYGLERRP